MIFIIQTPKVDLQSFPSRYRSYFTIYHFKIQNSIRYPQDTKFFYNYSLSHFGHPISKSYMRSLGFYLGPSQNRDILTVKMTNFKILKSFCVNDGINASSVNNVYFEVPTLASSFSKRSFRSCEASNCV